MTAIMTGGGVPTAQSAIELLVPRGDLVETTGRKRNRFYFSQTMFDAVYGMSPETSDEQTSLFDAVIRAMIAV